jgi:ribosomal protein S3
MTNESTRPKTKRAKQNIAVQLTDQEVEQCEQCARLEGERTGYPIKRAAWMRKVILDAIAKHNGSGAEG